MVMLLREFGPSGISSTRVFPPPLSVMRLPPSMFTATRYGVANGVVTVIVTGFGPQSKVMLPPT